MIESFSVGEIAILQNCPFAPSFNGQECTVVHLPQPSNFVARNGKITSAGNYTIESVDGEWLQVPPRQLRKRRPPQDWVKLCKLDSLPQEEVA